MDSKAERWKSHFPSLEAAAVAAKGGRAAASAPKRDFVAAASQNSWQSGKLPSSVLSAASSSSSSQNEWRTIVNGKPVVRRPPNFPRDVAGDKVKTPEVEKGNPVETHKPTVDDADREKIREERRERRKKMKEKKRKEKEEQKRMAIYLPKNTKIQMITSEDLQKVSQTPSKNKKVEANLKDEEYPKLGGVERPKEIVLAWTATDSATGRVLSDAESGSEWEDQEEVNLNPTSNEEQVKSFDVTTKKVKKSDPVTLDLFSMMQTKKKKNKKKTVSVVATKVRGGNMLDSSAPSVRRGKEREKPRTKRKSKMKKIILAERARKKELRKSKTEVDQQDEDEQVDPKRQIQNKEEEQSSEKKDGDKEAIVTHEESKDLYVTEAKKTIHSKKFRDKMDEVAVNLIKDLIRFQDKQHAKDPVKAKAKRRYVVGLREVSKFIKVNKVTLVLLAPDIEPVESKGGLNDFVAEMVSAAAAASVPVVFVMNRRKLGWVCLRKVPISCIGIINYQGSDENFNNMMSLLPLLQDTYKSKLDEAVKKRKLQNFSMNPLSREFIPGRSYHQSYSNYPIEDPSEEIRREFLAKIMKSSKS